MRRIITGVAALAAAAGIATANADNANDNMLYERSEHGTPSGGPTLELYPVSYWHTYVRCGESSLLLSYVDNYENIALRTFSGENDTCGGELVTYAQVNETIDPLEPVLRNLIYLWDSNCDGLVDSAANNEAGNNLIRREQFGNAYDTKFMQTKAEIQSQFNMEAEASRCDEARSGQ